MKSEKKRLHFLAIFTEFINTLRNLILPAGVGLIAGLRHFSDFVGYLFLIPLALAAFDFFGWLRFSYEITDEHFHIQSGVLIRNDRYIRISRIQSVQIQTNILLRLFGLVQLKLDTADPADKGDVTLSVLTKKEAERVKIRLGHGHELQASADFRPESAISAAAERHEKEFKLSGRQLIAAAVTSANIGIIGVLLAILSQADDLIPDRFWGSSVNFFRHLPLITSISLLLSILLLLWLISLAITVFRWGGFRLTVTADQWHVHKGILETTDETYKTDRVQAIRIKEHLLQQLFGFCTVYAECSGSVDDEKHDDGSVLVFPIVRKRQLPSFLEEIIPRFAGQVKISQIPVRGSLYGATKPLLLFTVAFSAFSWFFPWGKWCWPLLPMIAVFSFFCCRSAGFFQVDDRIVLTKRFFAKTSVITLRKHIQTFTRMRSPIQRRLGLGSCELSIRSSSPKTYTIHHLETGASEKLFRWFRK